MSTRRRTAVVALAALAALALAALFPRAAAACPRCSTAVAARRSFVDDDPLKWSLIAVTPFAGTFLLAAAAYRIGAPSRAPRRGARARNAHRPHQDAEREST